MNTKSAIARHHALRNSRVNPTEKNGVHFTSGASPKLPLKIDVIEISAVISCETSDYDTGTHPPKRSVKADVEPKPVQLFRAKRFLSLLRAHDYASFACGGKSWMS